MRETWAWFLGREDPLEKEMATHSSIVAWRIPWMEEPGGLQSTEWQRVGHDWVTSLSLFIIGDWNAKVGSQETPGVTGNFDLGIRNEEGQRLVEFCQENALVIANILFQQHKRREDSTHGHHQMVNTKIRLIIFFAAKDGEALYSQQKQDQELTVAQIINSLLPNSDLNWRK